jgi:hypothetical protein
MKREVSEKYKLTVKKDSEALKALLELKKEMVIRVCENVIELADSYDKKLFILNFIISGLSKYLSQDQLKEYKTKTLSAKVYSKID